MAALKRFYLAFTLTAMFHGSLELAICNTV